MASAAAWAPPRSARHVRSLDAVVVDARAVRAAAEALGGAGEPSTSGRGASLPPLDAPLDAFCVVWAVREGEDAEGAEAAAWHSPSTSSSSPSARPTPCCPTSHPPFRLAWLHTSEAVPLPAQGGPLRWANFTGGGTRGRLLGSDDGGRPAPAIHLHVLARRRRPGRRPPGGGETGRQPPPLCPWPTAPGLSVARPAPPHPPGDLPGACAWLGDNDNTDHAAPHLFLLASATLALADGRHATPPGGRTPGAGAPPGTIVLTVAGAGRLEWRPSGGGEADAGAPPPPPLSSPTRAHAGDDVDDAGHLAAPSRGNGAAAVAAVKEEAAPAVATSTTTTPQADAAAVSTVLEGLRSAARRLAAARAAAAAGAAAVEAELRKGEAGGGAAAAQQHSALAAATASSAAAAGAGAARAARLRSATAAVRAGATARATALASALRGLAAARAQLGAAADTTAARLHRAALGGATRALAARRAALVAATGDALAVGTTSSTPVNTEEEGSGAASTPWARLEAGWSGGVGAAGDGGGGRGGSSVSGSEGGPAPPASSSARSLAGWLFGGGGGGPPSVAGSGGGGDGGSTTPPPTATARPRAHPPPRFTIGGLPLDPGIARAWSGGPSGRAKIAGTAAELRERARADAAALGAAAALTAAAASALGIPLRHPLACAGPRSAVLATAPPAGTARGRCDEGRGDAVGAAVLLPGALPPGQQRPRLGAGSGGGTSAAALSAPSSSSPAAVAAAAALTGEGAFPLWPPGDGGSSTAVVSGAAAAAAVSPTSTTTAAGLTPYPPPLPTSSDPARFAYGVFLLARDVHQVLDALGLAPPPQPGAVLDALVRIVALARQGRGG